MRFLIAILMATSCFANIDDNLISAPEVEIYPGISLEGWMDDFAEAQKLAEREQKTLLIAFLGPNWCSWSDKLEEEILANPVFRESLEKEVVFVKIEIPEDFENTSFNGKERKEQYQVNECPCLVLAHPSGAAIAKLDYLPIESKDFARYIKQTLSDYKRISNLEKSELKHMKLDELQYLYTHAGRFADQTFKKALLEQGLKVDKGPYFLLEEYGNMLANGNYRTTQLKRIRNKILARDPDNSRGCQRKLAILDFEALARVQGQEVHAAVRPLIEYLNKFGTEDRENAWKLEMKISKYCFSHDQMAEALRHAQASLSIAPETAKKDIAQSIEYLHTISNQVNQ